ncbi:MAG: hypothetical protein KBD78_03350 [Oligoflexales bacterium]|nr:hypothetical protein [Oligoflexales bacterium]
MRKLFLVRRDYENYIGPFSLTKLVAAYKAMEFGLSDEVSGSCGPWVKLEHQEELKKNYAEIYNYLFNKESVPVSEYAEPIRPLKRRRKRRAQKPSSKWLWFVVFAAALALVTIFSSDWLVLKLKPTEFNVELFQRHRARIERLQKTEGLFSVRGYVANNSTELVQLAMSSPEAFNFLIPFLRYYAYANEGELKGLDVQYLRGTLDESTPKSCSVTNWKKQWQSLSGLSVDQFESVAINSDKDWYKLLLWNRAWINRRQSKLWLEPLNYYQACIQMAQLALDQLVSGNNLKSTNPLVLESVQNRLIYLQHMVAQSDRKTMVTKSIFSVLTCLDSAKTFDEIEDCSKGFSGELALKPLLEQRVILSYLGLYLNSESPASAQLVNAIRNSTSLLSSDPITKLNMDAEKNLHSLLLGNNFNRDLVLSRLTVMFPEVNFR